MTIKLTKDFIKAIKTDDKAALENLRSLYDEIIEDAKKEYKSYGLVDMDAQDMCAQFGIVYVDKDDEIFYVNSVYPCYYTGQTERQRYAKKKIDLLKSYPGIISIADYTYEQEEDEIRAWFENELVEQMDFISFEEFVSDLIA